MQPSPELRTKLLALLDEPPVHPGLIDARYVLRVLDTGIPAEWQSRVLGDFPDSTEDTIITRSMVERARANATTNEAHPLEAGIDVARFGQDRSVVFPRRGPVVYEPISWQGYDTVDSTNRIMAWAKDAKPKRVRVDAGAMGPGIIDPLRHRAPFAVVELNSGEKASDPETYANRRAEMWFTLRKRFEDGAIDLSRLSEQAFQMCKSELTSVRYLFRERGVAVEPKDKTKARLGRSPDYADALVYAFAQGKDVWVA